MGRIRRCLEDRARRIIRFNIGVFAFTVVPFLGFCISSQRFRLFFAHGVGFSRFAVVAVSCLYLAVRVCHTATTLIN